MWGLVGVVWYELDVRIVGDRKREWWWGLYGALSFQGEKKKRG